MDQWCSQCRRPGLIPIQEARFHAPKLILHDAADTQPSQTDIFCFKKKWEREFPGSPVVRTRALTAMGLGLVPGWRTKISQVLCPGQNK